MSQTIRRRKPAEPVKSAREIELEAKLKAETERREAAEAKLVGVQAKFDEAKADLERETAEMRDASDENARGPRQSRRSSTF